jgi:hypothetical protein
VDEDDGIWENFDKYSELRSSQWLIILRFWKKRMKFWWDLNISKTSFSSHAILADFSFWIPFQFKIRSKMSNTVSLDWHCVVLSRKCRLRQVRWIRAEIWC